MNNYNNLDKIMEWLDRQQNGDDSRDDQLAVLRSILLKPPTVSVEKNIAGALYRYSGGKGKLHIVMAGGANTGKSEFIATTFDPNHHPRHYSKRKELRICNELDATKTIRRIPVQPIDNAQAPSIYLWDTPGLWSDTCNPETTKALLGLPTRLKTLRIVDFERSDKPAEMTRADFKQAYPDDKNTKRVLCFVVREDMENFVLVSDVIREYLLKLSALFDGLVVLGTHADVVDSWTKETRLARLSCLQETLGEDYIRLNGKTKAGFADAVRAIFVAAGISPHDFFSYVKDEMKASRFFYVIADTADLLAAVLSKGDTSRTEMLDELFKVSDMLIRLHYSVDEEAWTKLSGDLTTVFAEQDMVSAYLERREAWTVWELIKRDFDLLFRNRVKIYYTGRTIAQVQSAGLTQIISSLYFTLHELQSITSAPQSHEDVIAFVSQKLESIRVSETLKDSNGVAIRKAILDTMLAVFRKFHPEALDLKTREEDS